MKEELKMDGDNVNKVWPDQVITETTHSLNKFNNLVKLLISVLQTEEVLIPNWITELKLTQQMEIPLYKIINQIIILDHLRTVFKYNQTLDLQILEFKIITIDSNNLISLNKLL